MTVPLLPEPREEGIFTKKAEIRFKSLIEKLGLFKTGNDSYEETNPPTIEESHLNELGA